MPPKKNPPRVTRATKKKSALPKKNTGSRLPVKKVREIEVNDSDSDSELTTSRKVVSKNNIISVTSENLTKLKDAYLAAKNNIQKAAGVSTKRMAISDDEDEITEETNKIKRRKRMTDIEELDEDDANDQSHADKLQQLQDQIDQLKQAGRKGKSDKSDDIDNDLSDNDDDFGILTKSSSVVSFRSLCGSDIPDAIMKSIKKGQYVDFHELHASLQADVEGGPMGDKQGEKNKQTNRSLNFPNWYRVFDNYMNAHISTHTYADNLHLEIMQMNTYKESIFHMWKSGGNWACYDIHFRKKLARERSKWHQYRFDLIQLYSGPPPSRSASHSNSSLPPGLKVPFGYCQDFHARKSCSRHACRYDHRCFKCVQLGYPEEYHPATNCSRLPASCLPASSTAATAAAHASAHKNANAASASKNAPKGSQYVYSTNHTDISYGNQILTKNLPTNNNSHNTNLTKSGLSDDGVEVPFSPGKELVGSSQSSGGGGPEILEASQQMDSDKLQSSPSPILPNRLQHLLHLTNYDVGRSDYLVRGFTQGFKIGHYDKLGITGDTFSLSDEETNILLGKIEKEIQLGRVAGPFEQPPFNNYHISPLFLRPKTVEGEFRMIMDLSFPKDGSSINANILESEKKVHYASVQDAFQIAQLLPGGYSCKIDIKDAFRLLPIHATDLPKLCFKINKYFYYDRVLPQGCGSSCALFERFSTAIHHIFAHFAPGCKTVHYLDDYLFYAPTKTLCLGYRDLFISLCKFIQVPLAPHKITEPALVTTFLGITLDSGLGEARLPTEKVQAYTKSIQDILSMNKISIRHLQSIIGKLSFATAVLPARVFLRSLIQLLPKHKGKTGPVVLSDEAKADLHMWIRFLKTYNGITLFRALRLHDNRAINLQADASKKAFGATYRDKWVQGSFPPVWQEFNIAVLEFFPIIVLLDMFGHEINDSVVIFNTDNEAVSYILQDLTSKHPIIVQMLRDLVFLLLKHNIDLRSVHVPGKNNILCDSISRLQVTVELLDAHGMEHEATPLPAHLQPSNYELKHITTSEVA